MSQLGNLKNNLYKIQNDLYELEKSHPLGYEFCEIIKDLNAVRKGCVKFKNVVMKKEVLPSRYIKPVDFMIEGGESQLNVWIDHLNKGILNLDHSLVSSKNYNDIYKFVRNINTIEKNALKIINYIKQLGGSFDQQGGAWDDDFKRNMEELSTIGKQLGDKMNQTSSLIDGLEMEYNKMKPIYDEKMKIYADNCFPECSIVDGKWAGTAKCVGNDKKQEQKARLYYNNNVSNVLDPRYKNTVEIDPIYRCKSSSAAAAGGDCFPKCALNDLGAWKGWSACTSTDEINQEERARAKWERENSQKLEIGTDDFLTIIDPKYRCAS